ncbi:MAG: bifunctional UDP-N-acetylglucosamine diphosphorylase/glucosamine-1-phosphate N-acetyltransferase GlmU [Anaerolineales bacterium]|nr:bifunctional UDP-N-acetylglucosamine diphosphorylase/glucosamine-1-phosphate N-acetyltransferase GlmU [Anaerolineales bacterium]
MIRITPLILAAGQGTRMKSKLPKMLHKICGQPMVFYALAAARAAGTETPVLVVGHGAEAVQAALGEAARFAIQAEQLGTGHAVMQAESLLKGQSDLVLVTYGDMPLLRPETVQRLAAAQQTNPGPISLLTVIAQDPRGFGRIVRKADDSVAAIVEEAQADSAQLALKELNVGAYCFRSEWLWAALKRIPLSPKGEYYLTDTIALAVEQNLPVQAILLDDMAETIGVNSRVHLAEAEAAMRKRINTAHLLNGVTMIQPETIYIEAGVRIGRDTVLWPNTYLHGETQIGEDCAIGPNTIIRNTKIGDRCKLLMSDLESAVLENDIEIGPFARLRKGAHLGNHVHMGNFGEVKDSHLSEGVKMGHFSYIGNAEIGANTNIGAGTITCNYDGQHKHPTTIGEDVFIGSDTMLVAPLKIGARSRTGAGAVVTRNVPEDTLVVGVPARAIKKLDKKND